MIIEKLVQKIDKEITVLHEEYIKLHEKLDEHRGKAITDTNLPQVNKILKDIQDKFLEQYPALLFIAQRYQFSTNAINSYNEFIESIKKAGASADEEQSKIDQSRITPRTKPIKSK